jgi:hypothetical protein
MKAYGNSVLTKGLVNWRFEHGVLTTYDIFTVQSLPPSSPFQQSPARRIVSAQFRAASLFDIKRHRLKEATNMSSSS